MPDYHIPLSPTGIYHVLSRAIGDEKLFREEDNYRFFLDRFQKYISPIANIYSYCLLPNHFHFLLQIKEEEDIKKYYELIKPVRPFSYNIISDFAMERFSNLLNSYCKAYNKRHRRKGSLFIDYLRRVEIATEEQFCKTVFYIHKNPVHHGYCNTMQEWQWSSYNALLGSVATEMICSDKTLKWFDDKSVFVNFHEQPILLKESLEID
jgi:putative transposase